LRIIHLLAPAPVGGLEAVVQSLTLGQKRKGHDVQVISLLESGILEPAFLGRLRNVGIPVLSITTDARAFLRQRSSVEQICAEINPDVLHSHGYLPDVLSASLGANFAAARLSTVHGFTRGSWRNRFYELLQRFSHWRLDAVVTVSRKLATDLASFRPRAKLIEYVQNAWTVTHESIPRETARSILSLSQGLFHIGWVGRLSKEKGLDVLIEALPALLDVQFHLTVFGDGPERHALERRAMDLKLADRISWRGLVTDAPRLLPAFDVFVLSSRSEGTPITLFEAMQAAIPIVATSVGGVPEILSANEALLVRSDSPNALAVALRQIHHDPVGANLRVAAAKHRLERDFAGAPWIDAYENIYRRVISARRSR
jgi:glycosyltransferase involved in cell wall biosynthesis